MDSWRDSCRIFYRRKSIGIYYHTRFGSFKWLQEGMDLTASAIASCHRMGKRAGCGAVRLRDTPSIELTDPGVGTFLGFDLLAG